MKKIIKLIIVIIMAGLTACEKEILYTDIAPEPLLVVNGVQHVGEPARLCVEKSSFYSDVEADFRVKDVHANLYVNGVFKESLQVRDSVMMETYWISDEYGNGHEEERPIFAFNYCEGTYILCEGDELRFEVSSSEFDKTAIAETTMPSMPNVISFDTVRIADNNDGYGGQTIYFSLVIDDPTGKDYYNLFPKYGLEGFTSTDPVFADFMNIVHVEDLFGGSNYYANGPYNMFNDAYFDGKQYTVALEMSIYIDNYYAFLEPFVLEVTKADYNLYQFKKSFAAQQFNDNGVMGLFTEPTQVYSNVQNGVGVVCSQSQPVTVTVDLTIGN
jgi:hypothetical protein